MANPEHLKILKQGVEVWNRWRKENPELVPELENVDLEGAYLDEANLANAILRGGNLEHVFLRDANLQGADLQETTFGIALVRFADLQGANLSRADLQGTDFHKCNLAFASLRETLLDGVNFCRANLRGADFYDAAISDSVFADVDLQEARNLDAAEHFGPSVVDGKTLSKAQGNIPDSFLSGCGLSDWEIAAAKLYGPTLSMRELADIAHEIHRLRGESPIHLSPLFISYAHDDLAFIEALEKLLDEKRIRYWRDAHDMKAGRMEKQIERAIRHNPIVLLVLSENSVRSDWVWWEAQKARDLEKELGRDVLCPVALDDAWKTCSWPGPLRRQIEDYYILDFSEWEDSEVRERQFPRLIDGLGINYPRPSGE